LFTKKISPIDEEINRLITQLSTMNPKTKGYVAVVKNLETLYQARGCKSQDKMNWESIIGPAASLISILLIMNHEELHVISTKALGFIWKGKV